MKLIEFLKSDITKAEVTEEITAEKPEQTVLKKAKAPLMPEKAEVYKAEATGLSDEEAEKRLAAEGENRLQGKPKIHPIGLFMSQYKDIMTLILLVCTAISVFMGEITEAITIAVIILMNGVLGFVQEYKTEKTLNALKEMASPLARVYRGGILKSIEASKLVCGDVIRLSAGDRIPADCEISNNAFIETDESMLTGESLSVKKNIGEMIYMGCVVTSGHAEAVVKSIGMKTKMGGIAHMLNNIADEPTPLQKRLAQLSKYIAAGCLLICTVVSITGLIRGEALLDMLITGVSLAVAAVPEGLPAIVTISLALSVSRMVKRNALVRRLHAVETLGCATVICTDKTGTITQNKMTVTAFYKYNSIIKADELDAKDKTDLRALCGLVLCNSAEINGKSRDGSTTEIALLDFAEEYNITRQRLLKSYRIVDEIPFTSKRKMMSVLVKDKNGKASVYVKGAYDIILPKCTGIYTSNGIVPIEKKHIDEITKSGGSLANDALRLIAICYKPTNENKISEDDLIFIGLAGIIDPPRKEVKDAVSKCRAAGIRTVMITGDHKNTATAIAKKVGIFKKGDNALTGESLDIMTDDELQKEVGRATVFARVSPEHKLRIVKALKRQGEIVAMTGDGVNDAPAVKEADIGVSMGITGTDVTKEAAEIILLDDNFATLVNAAEEGRGIYKNIRKFIRYLLSCNIGEVITMFVGMIMGMPTVLLPAQILLVNLVTDGLPAIALGLEPNEAEVMSEPPRKPNESVFSNGLSIKIFLRGIMIGASTLLTFATVFGMTQSLPLARSGALFSLVMAQLIHVFECKSETKPIYKINLLNNKKLIFAALFSLGILLVAIYFAPAAAIFKTAPLSLIHIMVALLYCMIGPIISTVLFKK